MKHLFIGGPIDGEWRSVPDGLRGIVVPIPRGLPTVLDGRPDPTECVYTAHYHRQTLAANSKKWHVFLHYDLNIEDAMQMMLENYTPKTEKKPVDVL